MKRNRKKFRQDLRNVLPLVVAAATFFALTGCGGGDSTAASSSPSKTAVITKEQLIKRGDAICRKTDKAQIKSVADYEKTHGSPANPKELETELAKVAPAPLRAEIAELAALGAPEGEEKQVEAIIDGLEKALQATEAKPSVLMSFSEGFFIKPGKLAEAYGFTDCGQPD